jgi:hypothetical protein
MNRRRAMLICIGFVVLAMAAALWKGALPLEGLIIQVAALDRDILTGLEKVDVSVLRRAVRLQVVVWSLIAAGVPWLFLFSKEVRSALRERLFRISMFVGCSTALWMYLWHCGWEAKWYPIETLMKNPAVVPIFGRRLLWVWIADLCHKFVPSISYAGCYFASQALAIVLTVIVIGRWSALFIKPALSWIGQVLLVVLLSSTFNYFTFYDISIVFFYALCLLLLYRRRYIWFAVAVGIATLNHENAMLLVMVAALETFQQKFRVCAGVTLGSLALHMAARLFMAHLYPSVLVDLRFWTNLVVPLVHPKMLIASSTAFVFWWACAGVAWPNVEPFLRRVSILLPLLIAVTFTFGKFIEARQFVALIPVVIAFLLSFARTQMETTDPIRRPTVAA